MSKLWRQGPLNHWRCSQLNIKAFYLIVDKRENESLKTSVEVEGTGDSSIVTLEHILPIGSMK